jgi:hypothetical protein
MGGISSVWNHWAARQKNDEQGLVFLKASEGDMREKKEKDKKKKKDAVYVEDEDEDVPEDKGEGSSELVDPGCPFAYSATLPERLKFLVGLSEDGVYQRFVKALEDKLQVHVFIQWEINSSCSCCIDERWCRDHKLPKVGDMVLQGQISATKFSLWEREGIYPFSGFRRMG